jgi:protein-S-isoprenylcysteine O-methyltransferase Ste14
MGAVSALIGKVIFALGIIAWYVIRYPFERRAKRVRVVGDSRSLPERIGLWSATAGLGVIPAIYVVTGFPRWADYPSRPWAVAIGAIIYPLALLAGLAGFAVLFFLRVGEEERMMLRTFGDEYRAYMGRTKRIIPHVY